MLVYLHGLILGLTLIMALGPQNIFLIRQGAMRNHAALSAVICFLSDIILVTVSVTGLHHVLETHPVVGVWMTWFGAIFLLYYGGRGLKQGLSRLPPDVRPDTDISNRWKIIILALGFSLLNPHAIIDSIVLIGGGSTQYPGHEQAFLFGVITSSLLWFTILTATTYYFSKLLTQGTVWRRVELFSGILMIYLSLRLIYCTQL